MQPIDFAAHTLLWFRPLSPLNYGLPESLANRAWAATRHIPIDTLHACDVSAAASVTLNATPTWVLSSPTAAHLAAKLGAPRSIALMGVPSQAAWREAGGAEPTEWLISPTGESMGLESALRQHSSVCVLRGKQGRNDLIEVLRQADVLVSTVAMYDKVEHPQFAQNLNASLDHGTVALYLSSTDQAARLLATAFNKAKLLASPLLASHVRIADAALALGYQTVTLNQNSL
jgi:uroporphyrinogen-III synthase